VTKSLAREAIFQLNRAQRPAGDGIDVTVNAVTPGYIATEMMATIPDKALNRIRGRFPSAGSAGRQRRTRYVRRLSCLIYTGKR
jgi:NAD(P)-dependent dehydrogenase (short-subunit alcohol dehydrogenase family)